MGDDGDTASMTVVLHSPVACLGGRRGIKGSGGREEEMRVDIKKDNLYENEREACALDVSNTAAGSPSTNTETCSPNIDVTSTFISECLLVTTARFTAEPKRPYRSFRLLRLISLSVFQSTFLIHRCSAAAISLSSS
jgi:hypothetical protein